MEASLYNHRRNYTLHITSDGFIPPGGGGISKPDTGLGVLEMQEHGEGTGLSGAELANYTLARHTRAPTRENLPRVA